MQHHLVDTHIADDNAWEQAVLTIYESLLIADSLLSGSDSSFCVSREMVEEAIAKFGLSS